MTGPTTKPGNAGLDALTELPLLTSIWRRRTHRVSRGSSIDAESMSWTSSEPRTPLTELEEAVLISLTGCTGLTMPDRPFTDPRSNKPIMAKPNLNMVGRAAGSPDNAQGTYFFMINDTSTYFLRKLPPPEALTARRRYSTRRPLSRAPPRPSSACLTIASTCRTGTGTSRPTSTPTVSCRTCPVRPSCSPSSTCPGSTSTA